MNETLRDELQALAFYLNTSGADGETKIGYAVSKIELLIRKYKWEFEDERED